MGSGLILLAIVGAWLAVLVPMALRRYDTSNIVTVDKFHDAMRVLSRRGAAAGSPGEAEVDDEPDRVGRVRAAAGVVRERLAGRRDRPRPTAAARRRRLLLTLVVLSLTTLLGAVLGPLWLLAPHLVADLLLGAFVVHLRRTAVRRAEREWRGAMAGRPAEPPASRRVAPEPRRARPAAGAARPLDAAPAVRRQAAAVARAAEPVLRSPVHVAGIPERMPPRPAPLEAPAALHEELPAARGAQGEAWSPVPVPTPTYLSAPVAPRPVLDLTRAASDGLADAERELGIVDDGPQLDEILERRRAVNDW